MEALAGGWRKEAGWQPTWQDLGLGLCREGVSPETSGVFLRGFQRPQWQSQAPLIDIRCFALSVLFLLWCLLFRGVGTALVAGLKARLWPWTDSRGWQALPSHTWPHLLPGGTTQAPHPGAPFWCCLWAVAWWCQGVVVPLPSPVPSQSCLRAKQSEEHWAVPYINFQACLSGKFCSVLFCSFGVFFFCRPVGQQVLWGGCTGGSAAQAQVAGSIAVSSRAAMHADRVLH